MKKKNETTGKSSSTEVKGEVSPVCGIVMPISEIDECSAAHWKDVRSIIEEAARNAGYEARLVSQSDDVGVIQQRIVQNLYDCEIVVCDVSAKNANVMFELGLRLAFDKPAIVLKDNKTTYSFDTSPIEHLEYPRDLRYSAIQQFKVDLANKITATVNAAKKPDYTTFLKHFGKFEVAGLETKQVSEVEYLSEELKEIRQGLSGVKAAVRDMSRKMLAPSISAKVGGSTPSRAITSGLLQALDNGQLRPKEIETGSGVVYGLLAPKFLDDYASTTAVENAVDRAVEELQRSL